MLSLPILTLCKSLHKELQPFWSRDRGKVPRSFTFAFEAACLREHSPSGLHDLQMFLWSLISLSPFPLSSPVPHLKPGQPFKICFLSSFWQPLMQWLELCYIKSYGSGASHLSYPLNSLDISKIQLHQVQHSCLSEPTQEVNNTCLFLPIGVLQSKQKCLPPGMQNVETKVPKKLKNYNQHNSHLAACPTY